MVCRGSGKPSWWADSDIAPRRKVIRREYADDWSKIPEHRLDRNPATCNEVCCAQPPVRRLNLGVTIVEEEPARAHHSSIPEDLWLCESSNVGFFFKTACREDHIPSRCLARLTIVLRRASLPAKLYCRQLAIMA